MRKEEVTSTYAGRSEPGLSGFVAAATQEIQPDLRVTMSLGIACGAADAPLAALRVAADQRLCRARAEGRNRVVA